MAMDPQEKQLLDALNRNIQKLTDTMSLMARAQGARVDGRGAQPGEVVRFHTNANPSGSTRPYRQNHIERKQRAVDTELFHASQDAAESFSGLSASAEEAIEGLDLAAKEFTGAAVTTKEGRDSWQRLSNAAKKTVGFLSSFNELQYTHSRGFFTLGQHANKIVEGMGRFQSALAKATKAQSLLYAKQIDYIASDLGEIEQFAAHQRLTEALDGLSDGAKRALGVFDETTKKVRTNLSFEELAQKRTALGNVLADATEALSVTNYKSVTDMMKVDPAALFHGGMNDLTDEHGNKIKGEGDKNFDALVAIAAKLEAARILQPKHESLSVLNKDGSLKDASGLGEVKAGENARLFLEQLAEALAALENTVKKTDATVDAAKSTIGKFTMSIASAEGRLAAFNKGLNYLLTSAALFKATNGLKRLYEEVNEFNVAQIPATYMDVQAQSAQLGLSFKETSAILQENKRVLAIYGPKEFRNALGGLKDTFKSFGYTMAQAAELIGPTVEGAIQSGINIRDPGELNKYTKQMMDSFQSISGVVNISAKEYLKLNAEMFKSEGAFETLMGMDTQRRAAYAQELVQLRNSYAIKGLEIQQAQQLVQLQQQQQRDKIKSRVGDAAKAMALAQASGMGAQASMEIFNLSRKGVRSKEENARLTELLGQTGQRVEQNRVQGYGANGDAAGGYLVDALREGLTPNGALEKMMNAGMQMQATKEAGALPTNAEKDRASQLAKGNETLATFGNAINTVSTIMQSALLAAVTGTIVSMSALYIQTKGLSAAFGELMGKMVAGNALGDIGGGKGKAGRAGGKLGGLGSKIGGVAKSIPVGKLAVAGGIGLGGALLGAGANMAGDALTSNGYDKAGAGVSILGDAASWAATGAALGSIIPGVGTLAGGVIGGVAGGAMGIYNNWDKLLSPSTPSVLANPVIASSVPSSSPIPQALPRVLSFDAEQGAPESNINTPGQKRLIEVKDATATAQLASIANLASQMVELLTKINDKESGSGDLKTVTTTVVKSEKSTVRSGQSVPTTYSFVTGRPDPLAV